MSETQFDFHTKYTKTNSLSTRLLDGFFGQLEGLIRPLELHTVLEAGCGEGFSTTRLRKLLPAEVAFEASDIEDRLVAAARHANPDVPIRKESIYSMDRADNSADLVLALEVLEHLEDPARALAELCRVSRQWVIVSVPREPLWRTLNMARLKYLTHLGNTPGHLQHWSRGGFRRFVQVHADVNAVHSPIPWTIILAHKRELWQNSTKQH